MNGTSRGEIFDEASNWLMGGGIMTLALAPLALPGIALLMVAALPLVALGLAVAMVAAVVAAPVLLARRIWRWVSAKQLDRHMGAAPVVPADQELPPGATVVAGPAGDRLPVRLAGRPKG